MIAPGITPCVEDPGVVNSDSGPDFLCVKLRIGDILWVGNAEIHLCSSDWNKHKHHLDRAYNNVILHVVLNRDSSILSQQGEEPMTAVLEVNPQIIERAQQLSASRHLPVCAPLLKPFPREKWFAWLELLYQERLQEQQLRINEMYLRCNKDWAHLVHIFLLRYLGSRVNNEAMEQIALSLPPSILSKHSSSLKQLEALFLGQGGLLNFSATDHIEDYAQKLTEEYHFLRHKYNLRPLPGYQLRLLRLRPASFPHRRLAFMAALYHSYSNLPAQLMSCNNLEELTTLLNNTSLSPYWETHFLFGKESKKMLSRLSASTIQSIAINVLYPIQYFFAKEQVQTSHSTITCQTIPAEKNHIVRLFSKHKFPIRNAADTQALLHLHRHYCTQQLCSFCALGICCVAT